MGDYPPFLERSIAAALDARLRQFPVVVLTGARQTGKTTLVRQPAAVGQRRFASLDSLATLDQARAAPEDLIAGDDALTIDEVQRAPDLLLVIKERVDRHRRAGRYLLTGSANLLLLHSVSESLAGRASYLTLRPLTEREKRGDPASQPWSDLLRAKDGDAALARLPVSRPVNWPQAALAGGLPPAALDASPGARSVWFESYVETYLHRDVRDLAQVGDLAAFARLLRLATLRVGGLLNQADLARDCGVAPTTAQRWLSVLAASYAVTLLPAFSESQAKRLIKAPKLYCGDTGLGLHLAGIETAGALSRSPAAGYWLENLILNDLLVWRELEPRKPGVFFRRTAAGEEVDLVVEHGRRLLPIEVKASAAVRVKAAQGVERFCEEFAGRAPFGLLVHTGAEARRLTRHCIAVPLGSLL